jgi:hypothetical protein
MVGVLFALLVGCADFEKEEQAFCERNPASCGEQPVPPGATSLAFSTAPQTLQVGSCSGVVTVQLRDTQGMPVNATADTRVELSTTPTGAVEFFTQAGCTGAAVTVVTISANASSAGFYFKGARVGAATLNAAAGTLSGSQAVNLTPSPAVGLALTLPAGAVNAGECTPGGGVQAQDAAGVITRVTADTLVSLQAAPAASLSFFSDASCTASVATVLLRPSEDSAPFYLRGQVAGAATVTAEASGLSTATGNVTVAPGAGNRLVFRTAPLTVTAGTCSGIARVASVDAQGNASPVSALTAVTLSATPNTSFKFYSDASCTAEVTSIGITSGGSETSFYFRGTRAGQVTVSTTAQGFTGTLQVQTINPGPPAVVAFGDSVALQAGNCSTIITVELRDSFGNLSPTPANRSIGLSSGGTVSLYSDSGCASFVSSVTVPLGASSASFYVRGNQAGLYTITGASNGLTSGLVNVTINPGPPTSIAFSNTPPADPMLAGTCAMRTLESFDAYGNRAASALTLTLSGSRAAEFFSDPGCTMLISEVSIPQGSGSVSFYFKGYTGGSNTSATLQLMAESSQGLTTFQTETILPTVRRGSCTLSSISISCNLGLPVTNLSRSFLVFQATDAGDTAADSNVRCFLNGTSQVRCERGSNNTGGVVSVQWTVAEFPSGVNVQHYSIPCGGDTTSMSLSPVTPTSTFLLLSSLRNTNDQGSSVPRLAELASSTTVHIRKTGGCSGASSDTNHLQVVDYPQAVVQRGLSSLPSGAAFRDVTLSAAVAADRSIVLYSYLNDSMSGTAICNRSLRGELTNNGGTLRFSRSEGTTGTGCVNSNFSAISYEVVQFPPGTLVQQLTRQLSATQTSTTLTLPTQVDASRTIVLMGGQGASGQAGGEGRDNVSQIMGEMRARATLNTQGTTVTLIRDSSKDSATFTVFVVQLKP